MRITSPAPIAKLLAVMAVSSMLTIGACKKSSKENPAPDGGPGSVPAGMERLVTPKPAYTGTAASKVIGPAGGTLTSDDGNIGIEVPAGAVSSATTFSIRPVENTLQPGVQTKTSYELLPHNVTFAKPVKIVMNYDMEAYAQTASVLQVAFREESTGQWKALPTTLDEEEGTLTVEKTSFSIFEFFERYMLFSTEVALDAGEETSLIVAEMVSAPPAKADDPDDLLAPLVRDFEKFGIYYIQSHSGKPKISNWRIVEGAGTLYAPSSQTPELRKYKAPSPLTKSFALVEVTLTNLPPIRDNKAPGGVRNGGELKLLAYISLLHGYVKVVIGGQEYVLKGNIIARTAGSKTFGIGGEADVPGVGKVEASVAVMIDENFRPRAGSFPFGNGGVGTATASVAIEDRVWANAYYDCNDWHWKTSSGNANFQTWDFTPGKFIDGSTSFNGSLGTSECQYDRKNIQITWHIPVD